jgi:hypothetical protein
VRERLKLFDSSYHECTNAECDLTNKYQRAATQSTTGKGYFDWLALFSIKSAAEQLKPDTIFVHILDGIEPTSKWWKKAKKIPGVKVRSFTSADVPSTAGKRHTPLKEPAHVSDFYRMKILSQEGGIYLDTDVIVLQPFTPLLKFKSVFGEQAPIDFGCVDECNRQATTGFQSNRDLKTWAANTPFVCNAVMLTAPGNAMFDKLYELSAQKFDGSWTAHSIDMLSHYFQAGVAEPEVSTSTLYAIHLEYSFLSSILHHSVVPCELTPSPPPAAVCWHVCRQTSYFPVAVSVIFAGSLLHCPLNSNL